MTSKKNITGYRFWLPVIIFLTGIMVYSSLCTAKAAPNPVKCRVELDRNVLPAKSAHNVISTSGRNLVF